MPSPSQTTSSRAVAVLVLGTDALLFARPLSVGRLAEACRRAGYQSVVPASWGDELIAAACLEALAEVSPAPAALCACPLVRAAAADAPAAVARLDFAAPPVAAARYVRELYGALRVHVTFAGACPGADHPEIDERITPEALMQEIGAHVGAVDAGADVVHDSERRYRSLPGGAPDVQWLADANGYALDAVGELSGPPRERTLYDFAPVVGCACAGASLDASGALPTRAARAREGVAVGEPARGTAPVVADSRAALMAQADQPSAGASSPEPPRDPRAESGPAARRAAASSRPAPRREVATLVMPARAPRRSEGGARAEVVEPIRPHKSSEPIWDGPRRFPVFGAAGLALIVVVAGLIYVNRPRPALPPFAELPAARQPVAAARPTTAPAGGTVVDSQPVQTRFSQSGTGVELPDASPVPPRRASSADADESAADAPRGTSATRPAAPAPTRPATSGRGAGRPGAATLPAAPTDAAAEQAVELRREIEARRARIDSLARSVDSLRNAEKRPPPPR